jgi:uncharacterized protein (TIGR02284 family)
MNAIDEKVIHLLNDLIHVSKDEQQGFEAAAREVRAGELRPIFAGYAAERGEYVRELGAQVFALGGDVKKSTRVSGSLHRGWTNLKLTFSSGEPSAVLVECERGEERAINAYEEALVAELDPETRSIVTRQANGIRSTHDHLRLLNGSVVCATS